MFEEMVRKKFECSLGGTDCSLRRVISHLRARNKDGKMDFLENPY
jgi:hypothetical protein